MKICNLASGSSGNCTYIETNNYKILIDMGRTRKYIVNALNQIGIDYKDIDYVFITHTHDDHTSAIKTFLKNHKAKLVITSEMNENIIDTVGLNKIVYEDDPIIENLNIKTIRLSHDAGDTRGFIIEEDGKSIVYITDTGYLKTSYFKELKNKTMYAIESNHDIEMLTHGPYPKYLQNRVLSDVGHLSNKFAGIYLSKMIGDNTKRVMLLHLSDKNNTPKLALDTVHDYIDNNVELLCANKEEVSKVFEL